MNNFPTDEEQLSQIPAVQLLINLGYEYLTPAETLRERQGKTANVLLETVLSNQLKEINRIRYNQWFGKFC
jgi:type I restriction enzyme R subunit